MSECVKREILEESGITVIVGEILISDLKSMGIIRLQYNAVDWNETINFVENCS